MTPLQSSITAWRVALVVSPKTTLLQVTCCGWAHLSGAGKGDGDLEADIGDRDRLGLTRWLVLLLTVRWD